MSQNDNENENRAERAGDAAEDAIGESAAADRAADRAASTAGAAGEPGASANASAQTARPGSTDPRVQAALDRYWRSNLRVMAGLLFLWAFVSFGCGILWAERLNQISLPGSGFPLGFWFAQQGSIAVFVVCILIYCVAMNRLDRRHHEELEAIGRGE